jgi:hypothetical protein
MLGGVDLWKGVGCDDFRGGQRSMGLFFNDVRGRIGLLPPARRGKGLQTLGPRQVLSRPDRVSIDGPDRASSSELVLSRYFSGKSACSASRLPGPAAIASFSERLVEEREHHEQEKRRLGRPVSSPGL